MSERLEALLIGERVLPAAIVREAVARQRVYGGGLDTALLEMGVMTEGALWARLATATGLPVPASALAEGAEVGDVSRLPLSQAQSAGLRAVPAGEHDRTLKLLCAEPVDVDEIRQAASRAGYQAKLYVVPEVRLLALRQRIYGEALPPRYAPILARGIGAERARKAFQAPKPVRPPAPPTAPRVVMTEAKAPLPPPPAPSSNAAVTVQAAPLAKGAITVQAAPTGAVPPPPPTPLPGDESAAAPTARWGALVPPAPPAPPAATLLMGVLSDPAFEPGAIPQVVAKGRSSGEQLTPLEHVLDISQPLLLDSALEQDIELGEEDLQVVGSDRYPLERTVTLTADPDETGDGVPLTESGYAPSEEGPTDSATEALCRRARDREDKGRMLALRALRRRLEHRLAQAFVESLRQEASDERDDRAAITALECLGELRDEVAIPTFIDRLSSPNAAVRIAAGQALVMLTARDFADAAAWDEWWNANALRTRAEWLLDALADRDTPTRVLAYEELRHLSGETFGYAPDLPRRKREAARRRWATWWETQRQQVAASDHRGS